MNDFLQIQNFVMTITARNHDLTALTREFLKYSGIAAENWE